jgi:hypothetical protein
MIYLVERPNDLLTEVIVKKVYTIILLTEINYIVNVMVFALRLT